MTQYIDKSAVVAEIEKLVKALKNACKPNPFGNVEECMTAAELQALDVIKETINTLEVKEVDFGKLGEIARHLIAVKEHIEDMRLDKEEWFMLEKIGYPETFKAQKGE
jgi:hypothetical protein